MPQGGKAPTTMAQYSLNIFDTITLSTMLKILLLQNCSGGLLTLKYISPLFKPLSGISSIILKQNYAMLFAGL